MDDLKLLIDFHIGGKRQGPGSDGMTRRAIDLSGLSGRKNLHIADIGSGTGAASLVVAKELEANVSAVDLFPEFLTELEQRAAKAGLSERIETIGASMDALTFGEHELDAIWSEGAIYNIGFETGIREWRRFLKPGGILAVSELTWLTQERPQELTRHWDREYPEVGLPSQKIAQLERHGYELLGYFPLPPECWLDEYYTPILDRMDAFLARHGHSDGARAIAQAEEAEIALYQRFSDYVSYGFYVARKCSE